MSLLTEELKEVRVSSVYTKIQGNIRLSLLREKRQAGDTIYTYDFFTK